VLCSVGLALLKEDEANLVECENSVEFGTRVQRLGQRRDTEADEEDEKSTRGRATANVASGADLESSRPNATLVRTALDGEFLSIDEVVRVLQQPACALVPLTPTTARLLGRHRKRKSEDLRGLSLTPQLFKKKHKASPADKENAAAWSDTRPQHRRHFSLGRFFSSPSPQKKVSRLFSASPSKRPRPPLVPSAPTNALSPSSRLLVHHAKSPASPDALHGEMSATTIIHTWFSPVHGNSGPSSLDDKDMDG
jgi:hypothetical protein